MNVAKKAGTTHGIHWVKANQEIKLIDSPGVIPLKYEEESKLGLISARNAEKMKEPDVVAAKIIEFFMKRGEIKRFLNFYGLKNNRVELEKSENPYEIIESMGLEKKHLRKGGLVDDLRTSMIIVRDWQEGKLKV